MGIRQVRSLGWSDPMILEMENVHGTDRRLFVVERDVQRAFSSSHSLCAGLECPAIHPPLATATTVDGIGVSKRARHGRNMLTA